MAKSSGLSSRKKILAALLIIAILAIALIAIAFLAPDLLSNIGGTFGTTATSALQTPSIDVPGAGDVTPSSPFENVEEKTNPFSITNPFAYGNPFE